MGDKEKISAAANEATASRWSRREILFPWLRLTSQAVPKPAENPVAESTNPQKHLLPTRRKFLIAGITATTPIWWPFLYKTSLEFIRHEQPYTVPLDQLPPNSVGFGFAPDKNNLALIKPTSEFINYQPPIINIFHEWNIRGRNKADRDMGFVLDGDGGKNESLFKKMDQLYQMDILPMISSGPPGIGEEDKFLFKNISEDPQIYQYLVTLAHGFKEYGKPVLYRMFYEMNGNWWAYGWQHNSSQDFIVAWRTIVDIFRKEGAHNVLFAWCPNSTLNLIKTPHHISEYYPEDGQHSCVDLVGLNVFDWYNEELISLDVDDKLSINFNNKMLQVDASPQANFGPDLAFLQKTGKISMISELGSMRRGIKRAEWEEKAIKFAASAGVKFILSFTWNKLVESHHSSTERDWTYDTYMGSMMRRITSQPYVYQVQPVHTLDHTIENFFGSQVALKLAKFSS